MEEKFNFGDDFSDDILACVIRHQERFAERGYLSIIKPPYFNTLDQIETALGIEDYFVKYARVPAFEVLGQFLFNRYAQRNPDRATALFDYVKKLAELETSDLEYILEQTVSFAKERAVLDAVKQVIVAQTDHKKINIIQLFETALKVGTDLNQFGLCFHLDYEAVVNQLTRKEWGVATGYRLLDEVWPTGWGPGWLISILGPPKRYKCEHPDTQILMFDGTTKRICEIKVGDRVMGDDSTPRRVLSCGKGYGPMYRVEQANGDNYTVNSDHILCLKRPKGTEPIGRRFHNRYHRGQILEITAKDYMRQSDWFKRTWKGYKVGVRFPTVAIPLDPYFVGLWLGDGNSHAPSITVGDNDVEIVTYLLEFARNEGVGVRRYKNKTRCEQVNLVKQPGTKINPIAEKLRSIGIFGAKHVPSAYKVNSREVRLQLLAGLIDSDGNHTRNRGFIFVNVNKQLCEDTCWVARSLGFKSFVRKVKTHCVVRANSVHSTAYRTYIQGKISKIPTKLPRKRGHNSAKASDRTTIKVTQIPNGKWFGFETDGNRRYLHGDFTVTHNTATALNLALNMIRPNIGADVIYFAAEIDEYLAMGRDLCNMTGRTFSDMHKDPDKFIAQVTKQLKIQAAGHLIFRGFPSKTATVQDMELAARNIKAHYKLTNLKAIFIDQAETTKPSGNPRDTPEHRRQSDIYTEARAMGTRLGCAIVMPDRCNKETVERPVPSMTSFQGAFEKAGIVDVGIGLCATEEEHMQNIMRIFVFLNRHGEAGHHFKCNVKPAEMQVEVEERIAWSPSQDQDEKPRKRKRFTPSPAEVHDRGYNRG